MANKIKDLTNVRVGKLIFLELVETGERGTLWRCACDCGNDQVIRSIKQYTFAKKRNNALFSCRECEIRNLKHPGRIKESSETLKMIDRFVCKVCGVEKHKSDFYYYKSKKKYLLNCKACVAKKASAPTELEDAIIRSCLSCGNGFFSKSKFNRMCQSCKDRVNYD